MKGGKFPKIKINFLLIFLFILFFFKIPETLYLYIQGSAYFQNHEEKICKSR